MHWCSWFSFREPIFLCGNSLYIQLLLNGLVFFQEGVLLRVTAESWPVWSYGSLYALVFGAFISTASFDRLLSLCVHLGLLVNV